MKKSLASLIVLSLCIGFLACDKPSKKETEQAENDTKSAVLHNSKAQSVSDDGCLQIFTAIAKDETKSKKDRGIDTVIISGTSFPKTITIKFDGTPDILGIVRTGSISGVLSDHFYLPNAQLTVDYNNYVVNGLQFKGTQFITNKNTTISLFSIVFDVVVSNASVVVNGATGTWSGNHRWEWTPLETKSTGTTNGINEAGIPYSTKTITPLIQKADCPLVGSGIIEVTSGIYTATIDFGDGSCNDKATFSFNGHSSEITFFY